MHTLVQIKSILSPVETGTFASILHSVACWDWYCHIHMVTSCHLLRLVLLHLYCTVWPVEIGTVTSIWQHLVTCWDWYCHIHMAKSCHLLRLVLSHPYGNILSPVETGTIMSILQYLAITYSDWYHHVHSASWMHSKVQLCTYSCATKHY